MHSKCIIFNIRPRRTYIPPEAAIAREAPPAERAFAREAPPLEVLLSVSAAGCCFSGHEMHEYMHDVYVYLCTDCISCK